MTATVRMPTEDDPVVIVHGDCAEILPSLGESSVDHLITDPPYSERTHAGARSTRPGMGLTVVKLVTFDSIDDAAFLALCQESVRVARRWVIMSCDWRHAVTAEAQMPNEYIRCGVWIKGDSAPQFTGDRPGVGWEAILMLHREGKKRWNGGGHHAVWSCGVERNNVHSTQKPLALVQKWIRDFTDPGEVILDCFGGSGTTAIAALAEGRRCIIIEKEEKYCDLIRSRVAEYMESQKGTIPVFRKVKNETALIGANADWKIKKGKK